MTTPRFKIWYADGFVFGGCGVHPALIPYERTEGVVCILQEREGGGRQMIASGDYYYLNTDDGSPQFRQITWDAILDRLKRGKPIRHFLRGEYVSDAKYAEFYQAAKHDPDLGLLKKEVA